MKSRQRLLLHPTDEDVAQNVKHTDNLPIFSTLQAIWAKNVIFS